MSGEQGVLQTLSFIDVQLLAMLSSCLSCHPRHFSLWFRQAHPMPASHARSSTRPDYAPSSQYHSVQNVFMSFA